MGVLDDYLAGLDEPARGALSHIRDLAEAAVPDAEQGTSYGLAALHHRGKPLLGLQAAKRHLALYPFSPEVIDALRERLEGVDTSKGTVRFTAEEPLPDDVVVDLVRLRAREIEG